MSTFRQSGTPYILVFLSAALACWSVFITEVQSLATDNHMLAYIAFLWCGVVQETFRGQLLQRGNSPFVYRDGTGWSVSLPYIRKIHVSMAIGIRAGIRLHKKVPMVKIGGSSKNDQNRITGKLLKLHFHTSVSVSTHVSQKPDRVKRRNTVNRWKSVTSSASAC